MILHAHRGSSAQHVGDRLAAVRPLGDAGPSSFDASGLGDARVEGAHMAAIVIGVLDTADFRFFAMTITRKRLRCW